MTVEALTRTAHEARVLHGAAGDIQRGDQVAFSSLDEEDADVAGEVTGMRRGPDPSTVAVVVDNRVHFVPADHMVIIIRGCTVASGRGSLTPPPPGSPAPPVEEGRRAVAQR